jgi:hypothetical protein
VAIAEKCDGGDDDGESKQDHGPMRYGVGGLVRR